MPLGAVATFIRGVTFKPSDVLDRPTTNSVGVMRTKNVQSILDVTDVLQIPRTLVRRDDQYLNNGDILVSSANSWNLVGRCSWVPELASPAAIGGFVTGLRVTSDGLDPRYLYHWFSSPRTQAEVRNSANQTTNIANLNLRRCEQLQLPLPPLDEQRRVASILDTGDSLRRGRREMLDLVESLERAVFADLFGNDENGFRGFDQDRLGAYIAEGPQNGLYKPSSAYGRGTPIVRIDSFKDGGMIGEADLKRVSLTECEVSRYALHQGDLVINRVNAPIHLGKSTCVGRLKEPTVYESNMMRLRLDTAKLRPEYVLAFLQTPYAKRQIKGVAKAAVNQSSINQADVQGLQLPVPPVTLQVEFGEQLKAVARLRLTAEREKAQLDRLFASLQQRAFSGQL